jgi:hypothetical protein
LFYKEFGSVPDVGASVMLDGARLTVLEMDNHRITLVKFEDTAVGADGVVRLADSSSAPDAGVPAEVPMQPGAPTREGPPERSRTSFTADSQPAPSTVSADSGLLEA